MYFVKFWQLGPFPHVNFASHLFVFLHLHSKIRRVAVDSTCTMECISLRAAMNWLAASSEANTASTAWCACAETQPPRRLRRLSAEQSVFSWGSGSKRFGFQRSHLSWAGFWRKLQTTWKNTVFWAIRRTISKSSNQINTFFGNRALVSKRHIRIKNLEGGVVRGPRHSSKKKCWTNTRQGYHNAKKSSSAIKRGPDIIEKIMPGYLKRNTWSLPFFWLEPCSFIPPSSFPRGPSPRASRGSSRCTDGSGTSALDREEER